MKLDEIKYKGEQNYHYNGGATGANPQCICSVLYPHPDDGAYLICEVKGDDDRFMDFFGCEASNLRLYEGDPYAWNPPLAKNKYEEIAALMAKHGVRFPLVALIDDIVASEKLNPWKGAVIDMLLSAHILRKEHYADPSKALLDWMAWENSVILDPLVSAGAQKLIAEALEKVDFKAEAGLCAGTFGGAREFLKDIRKICAKNNLASLRERQPPPNEQWCVGCSPENCEGCGP